MRQTTVPQEHEKEYTMLLNRILARFTMFDDVFSEYRRTVSKVSRGRCLASENLESLAGYWQRNCLQYTRFLDCVNAVPVPASFQQFHQILTAELRQYAHQVTRAQQAINWAQNSCCLATLQDAFTEMKHSKQRIDHALENVNGVAM